MTIRTRFPARRPLRLPAYDYSSPGPYFVTICAHNRKRLFGRVHDRVMVCNQLGSIVTDCWNDLAAHCRNIRLDALIVMPNHAHGIIWLSEALRAGLEPAPTSGIPLSEVVRGFKTFSARQINALGGTSGPVWQHNYYERVIRTEAELRAVRQYVLHNPANWDRDPENATSQAVRASRSSAARSL